MSHSKAKYEKYISPTAVIGEGTMVFPGATVLEATIGNGCTIMPGAFVFPGAVLGDNVALWNGATVLPGAIVPAGTHVKGVWGE
ncbi:hypothetical protein E6Q11_02755 [Candidatus Dojkabacteria bacterium]|uniref:Gamma carbonic anhydrase family protein n=1 Tax=Candidatus Dojkabacteria bacterium TaxID=2099670 RepID=A0A5C7J7S8_9BACT|nr:MAG: hypothetical protein E6Q11_02755 [Candidatus Dojkabacteria bacterium]